MSPPTEQQAKSSGKDVARAVSPLPMIQIYDTSPVAYDASGISVTVPETLTIKASLRRTTEAVRGWLLDTDTVGGDVQNNGTADGTGWKYVVPLDTAGKNYIFQATLVTVVGGVETVVASSELIITTV